MRAMLIDRIHPVNEDIPVLLEAECAVPQPGAGEILIKVNVCGVCHTELDEIEGRTPPPVLPVIPGHQVVGLVAGLGPGVSLHRMGERVGVGWIFSACGVCEFCQAGLENLCPDFKATGRDADGGYAEYMVVPEGFAIPIPAGISDMHAAPLLCAGAVGYRSLQLANLVDGQPLGLTGFGASGHLVLQMVRHVYPNSKVYVFTRSEGEQRFARELGAAWAGGTTDQPPERLQAVIDTTPAWLPVIAALEALAPGGRLVINAIRKEGGDRDELLHLNYERHLWMEKEIKSVANVTKGDISEFLALAVEAGIQPEVQTYDLPDAGQALLELKNRKIRGAKVLQIT